MNIRTTTVRAITLLSVVITAAPVGKAQNAEAPQAVWSNTNHSEEIYSLAISHDRRAVVSGGSDFDSNGFVRLWDANTGVLRWTTSLGVTGQNPWDPIEVTFSSNGNRILVHVLGRNRGFVLDTSTGEIRFELPLLGHDLLNAVLIPNRSEGLALEWDFDSALRIRRFDATDGSVLSTFDAESRAWLVTPYTGRDIAVSPDGRLFTSDQSGNWENPSYSVRSWDLQDVVIVTDVTLAIDGSQVSYARFSPDCSRLLTVGNAINLWNSSSGEHLTSFTGSSRFPTKPFAFSADGRIIVVCGVADVDQRLGFAALWNVATAELVNEVRFPTASYSMQDSPYFSAVALSDNGALFTAEYATGGSLKSRLARWDFLMFRIGPAIVLSDGRVQLQLSGPSGQLVRIQRSLNLRDWENWQTVTLDGTSLELTDELTQAPQRFYRAVEDDSTPTQ